MGAAASLLSFAASCATTTEIALPALDASNIMMAEALVVQSSYTGEFRSSRGMVLGAGEGAATAMGGYLGGELSGSEGAALFGIFWAPIALPISAVVGASMALTKEEVDAAVAAYERVGQDKVLLASLERKFIEALGTDTKGQWTCIEPTFEKTPEPCPGYTSVARLTLRPTFEFQAVGKYDPDIHLSGYVVALASVDHAELHAGTDTVVRATWAYREELGSFFTLTDDDAALLRSKVKEILEKFATCIAKDLFLAPNQETIIRKEEFSGKSYIEIPESVVARIQ
jgi:hypothetical protein